MKNVITIPAYEPSLSLLTLLDDVKGSIEADIVIVNDGSNEQFNEIFEQCRKSAVVLKHDVNMGKGTALKTALEYISENYSDCYIITMDSDGQHTPQDALSVLNKLKENPEALILGSRSFEGEVPFKSRFGNKLTRSIFHVASGLKLLDTQTGLRGFTYSKIPFLMSVRGKRYEYEMNVLMSCARRSVPVREVLIQTIYIENNAASHFNPVMDSLRIYSNIFRFCSSSLVAFAVDYVCFWILSSLTGSIIFSNITARIISSILNFSINRNFVFESKNRLIHDAIKYFALACSILIVNTVLLKALTDYTSINRLFAKIIVELLLFVASWLVQKLIIFRNKGYHGKK